MTDQQSHPQDHITSLQEYLQRIAKITSKATPAAAPSTDNAEHPQQTAGITSEEQKDHSQALFYRGHADSSWELKPAVYRTDQDGKSYYEAEIQMYQEMLRRSPHAFRDCKTTFERLIKMQHYGLPTRLLDLTQSPLVALYFACCERNEDNNSCDGAVLVIKAEKKKVYFQENLPSNTLSEFDFQYQREDVFEYIAKQYNTTIEESYKLASSLGIDEKTLKENVKEKFIRYMMRKQVENKEYSFHTHVEELAYKHRLIFDEIIKMRPQGKESNHLLGKFINMDKEILKNISEEYNINTSNFKSMSDFVNSYSGTRLVYPPLNNERIQRQQGAFICFPRYYFNEEEPNFSIESIIIAKNKKTAILDELKTIGISHAYLFPELDEQAKDIKNNIYPPRHQE